MKRNLYYVLCLFVILLIPSIAFSEFITPSVGKAQPGETVTYTVHLDTGQYDYDPVNWAPSGGSISSLGTSAIWTAPSQEGTYDIKASGWKCPKGKGKEKGGCEKISWSAHASGKSIKPIITDLTAKETNLIADGKQTSTITARVTWDGKPKSKITVNFSLLNNLGSLDKRSAVTDANGKVEVRFTVGKKPGTETITAKVDESSKGVNVIIDPKLERTTIEGPNYVAQGQSVTYTAKAYDIENKEWSYGNLSYTWSVDGSVKTSVPPSELTTVFNTIGNHTVSVIIMYTGSVSHQSQSKSYDKKITVFNVEVINVDATVPTVAKVNYKVNPSTVVLQSAIFTAPGKTETKNNISGNFYFTFNQDDLIVGEQILKLVGTTDGSSYTVIFTANRTRNTTEEVKELAIVLFPIEGGRKLYIHYITTEIYYTVNYSITYSGKTLWVGSAIAALYVGDDWNKIIWSDTHQYNTTEGIMGLQTMTYSAGIGNPNTYYLESSNNLWPSITNLNGQVSAASIVYKDPAGNVVGYFLKGGTVTKSIP